MEEQTEHGVAVTAKQSSIPSQEAIQDKGPNHQSNLDIRDIDSPISIEPLQHPSSAQRGLSYQVKGDQHVEVDLESGSKHEMSHAEPCVPQPSSGSAKNFGYAVDDEESPRRQKSKIYRRWSRTLWKSFQSSPLNFCVSILIPFIPGKRAILVTNAEAHLTHSWVRCQIHFSESRDSFCRQLHRYLSFGFGASTSC